MKNKTLKISAIIAVMFILVSIIINIALHRNYIRTVNDAILNLVGVIREEYPNVSSADIVNILNNQNGYAHGLERYGIAASDIHMIESTRGAYNILLGANIIIVIFLVAIFGALLLIYIKNRKSKVEELAHYIREISRKNYTLKLEENDEDELSLLQNELYKITVFLKEQSENALQDKKNVKDGVSDISHQLKTPLTSIMIGLDNLIDNEGMDIKTRKDFLHDMKIQIQNINFLISTILKLAKLDSNVISFAREEINVQKLLSEIIKNLENISKNKNVSLIIEGEKDVSFTGDYKWEYEALTNIIKNSIEHSSENGTVKISYRKLSIYTEITIEDNGKGIEQKSLKRIFERFYKGENSSNESIGIGLALSKKIIENDNGYINVNSEVNKGTIFTIKYHA